MQTYQYEYEKVEQYLHHRQPYLLVEKINSMSATEIETQKTISGDDFYIEGHCPGAAIFPGALMQELTTQSAGVLISAQYNPMKNYDTANPFHNEYALGALVKVEQARYKDFARPGDTLIVKVVLNEQVSNVFDFSASVSVNSKTVMRNSFQLANIKFSVLRGI